MKRSRIIPKPKENIILIVEGKSDDKFIKRIKELFDNKYDIDVVNAESGTRILKQYRNYKKIYPEKQILVLYDLDNIKTIDDIKKEYKSENLKLKSSSLYFINPKIELLFILWKEKKAYTIISDSDYQKKIEDIYEIKNYRKNEKQLDKIMKSFNRERIETIIKNIEDLKINRDSKLLPSTNFDELFKELFKK